MQHYWFVLLGWRDAEDVEDFIDSVEVVWRTDADRATNTEIDTCGFLGIIGDVEVEVVGAFFSTRLGEFARIIDFGGENAVGRVRSDKFRRVSVNRRFVFYL